MNNSEQAVTCPKCGIPSDAGFSDCAHLDGCPTTKQKAEPAASPLVAPVKLTESEDRAYVSICSTVATQGIPPTVKELASTLKLSRWRTEQLLSKLVRKWKITRRPRAARGIKIL